MSRAVESFSLAVALALGIAALACTPPGAPEPCQVRCPNHECCSAGSRCGPHNTCIAEFSEPIGRAADAGRP